MMYLKLDLTIRCCIVDLLSHGRICGNLWSKQRFVSSIEGGIGKFFTIDNLQRCRVVVIDWYCMCKRRGATTNHLLLHCPIASELWNMVFLQFKINWVMPRKVVEPIATWSIMSSRHRNAVIWSMIPLCLT